MPHRASIDIEHTIFAMQIICFEEEAFYQLIETVIKRVQKPTEDTWVQPHEAMRLLNIKKSALAELRYKGKIRYSQPQKKVIVYHRQSLLEYLEKSARNPF
jgi:hypothetical protein